MFWQANHQVFYFQRIVMIYCIFWYMTKSSHQQESSGVGLHEACVSLWSLFYTMTVHSLVTERPNSSQKQLL